MNPKDQTLPYIGKTISAEINCNQPFTDVGNCSGQLTRSLGNMAPHVGEEVAERDSSIVRSSSVTARY
jgi:hypothetical protein